MKLSAKPIVHAFAGPVALLLMAQPMVAEAARSADALPTMSQSASASSEDAQEHCADIQDRYVRVDTQGAPILDKAGKMIACRPKAGMIATQKGHPMLVALGLLMATAGVAAGTAGGGGGGSGGGSSGGGPLSPS